MKHSVRISALTLILALLLSSVSAGILPEQDHMALAYGELAQMTFDYDAFSALCDRLEAAAADGDRDAVSSLLEEVRSQYLLQDSLLTVASIQADQDVTDRAARERYLDRMDESYDVDDRIDAAVSAVLDSPCSDLVDREDMVFSMFLYPAEPMKNEERALYAREQELMDDYDGAAKGPFTCTIGGNTYTEAELWDAYMDWKITDEEYDQGLLDLAKAENEALGPIYLELLENRRTQAEYYRESDYADMMDRYYFYRDYDGKDIAAFVAAVKEEIVPLTVALSEQVDECMESGAYETVFTEEELLSHLRAGLRTVSPELIPALDYMETYGYYDIAYAPAKAAGAYTVSFPYAGAPFLLMQPEESDYDFTSLVHEFGHYNAFFCSENPLAYNIDLSEIHSQALELLMLPHYDQVFGNDAEAERLYTIYAILTSLVDGCMMDELERYAYSENPTLDQLNEKYMELLREYGYRELSDPETRAYGWVMTSHLFTQPLYYISYAVSAAAALELWERSLTGREGAVTDYLELVALGETEDFYRTLSRAGLSDPMSRDRLQAIAAAAKRETAPSVSQAEEPESAGSDVIEPQSTPEPQEIPEPEKSGVPVGMVILIGIGCCLAGAAAVALVLRRRR